MESLYSLLYPSRRDGKRVPVQYINTSAPVQLRYMLLFFLDVCSNILYSCLGLHPLHVRLQLPRPLQANNKIIR